MFIFLDETGNLTKDKNKYFIVASYTVGDHRRIRKEFLKWRASKTFPKRLRHLSELKFNDKRISENLRLRTVKFIADQDVRIFYTYVLKKNIPRDFRKKRGLETGKLYLEIVAATLDLYLPITESEFRVFYDRRQLKRLHKKEFIESLTAHVALQLPAKVLPQIEDVDSTAMPQVQVADWICGALGRYYEKKKNGEKYYEILKRNIVKEQELFKEVG